MVLTIHYCLVGLHVSVLESLQLVCLAAFELKWRAPYFTSDGCKVVPCLIRRQPLKLVPVFPDASFGSRSIDTEEHEWTLPAIICLDLSRKGRNLS